MNTRLQLEHFLCFLCNTGMLQTGHFNLLLFNNHFVNNNESKRLTPIQIITEVITEIYIKIKKQPIRKSRISI